MTMSAQDILANRHCGACTLCCKVFRVPEVEKPAGVLCRHCIVGTGCAIYERWPDVCRDFFCLWRVEASLDASWQPHLAGFVLSTHAETGNLVVNVDPDQPDLWRRAPYEPQFRQWAKEGMARFQHVMVHNGPRAMLVLPDRDVDIGEVGADEHIVFSYEPAGTGEMTVQATIRKLPPAAQP